MTSLEGWSSAIELRPRGGSTARCSVPGSRWSWRGGQTATSLRDFSRLCRDRRVRAGVLIAGLRRTTVRHDKLRIPTGCGAAWLARLLWEQEAAGSNPAIPTVGAVQGSRDRSTGQHSRSFDRGLTGDLNVDRRHQSTGSGSRRPDGRACKWLPLNKIGVRSGLVGSRLVHCERQVRSPSWAHNPEVAGSNPAPATRKYQVRGLIAGDGGRASRLFVGDSLAGQTPGARQLAVGTGPEWHRGSLGCSRSPRMFR